MVGLEFWRIRFDFRAVDPVRFAAGGSGNTIRGAFGAALRRTAPAQAYARLFEPRGAAPSGLRDRPRPFVLRCAHLDGAEISAGERFGFDVHWFDVRTSSMDAVRDAFAAMGSAGLGPGRGRAEFGRCEKSEEVIRLDPEATAVEGVTLRFVTPTELKAGSEVVERPEFGILFARLRDRMSALRTLYGAGPLEIDFRGMGARASAVRMVRCAVAWEKRARKSGARGRCIRSAASPERPNVALEAVIVPLDGIQSGTEATVLVSILGDQIGV